MSPKPDVLIVSHSFVRCFELFLSEGIDTKVQQNLNLSCSAQITFLGVGGRTVHKLSKFDLHLVRCLQPQIVILEIGSNDLSPPDARPKVVGSKIETLVQRLHAECQVETIVVCQTINRAAGLRDPPSFNDRVALLNQYLSIVLETLPFAVFWRHKGLRQPTVRILCRDRVHLNAKGQYARYWSYRGTILSAIKLSCPPAPRRVALPPQIRSFFTPTLSFVLHD